MTFLSFCLTFTKFDVGISPKLDFTTPELQLPHHPSLWALLAGLDIELVLRFSVPFLFLVVFLDLLFVAAQKVYLATSHKNVISLEPNLRPNIFTGTQRMLLIGLKVTVQLTSWWSSLLRTGLQVFQELESREHNFRQQFLQWFDGQFRAKNEKQYLKSSIKLLSASIRVDWFSVPIKKFLDRMPQLRQELVKGIFLTKGLVKGIFLTKASSPWTGNKLPFKSLCACPTRQISIYGMRQCLHCRLLGLILPTLILTTSRKPLPISFFLSACKWGYPTFGEAFRHNGTYQNITCGTSGLATMQGGLRNCLSLTGRVGRVKMSMTLFCPHHIGKHERRRKIPKKR